MIEWESAKQIIGGTRVLAGPQLSQQLRQNPEHAAFVLARYRTAAAMIGDALSVLEVGCGEGIGAGILAKHREMYVGVDSDPDGIKAANEVNTQREPLDRRRISFLHGDVLSFRDEMGAFDAVVSLDVIEHIPSDEEGLFMDYVRGSVSQHGVAVIGTPSANAYHLASPQSRAGHINNKTPGALRALMQRHFHRVQLMGMQDTSVHFGHPGMTHYVIAVGIGPR